MKVVRLLLIVFIGACNSQQPAPTDNYAQYKEYVRADSLARLHSDSAFYYYFNASENLTDSGYKATALQQMALIQQNAEDYNGSNESAIRSVALFNETNSSYRSYISYNYNLLGSNCLELQRYDDAFRYYDLAIRYADSANIPVYKINKGVAYQKTKEYDKAISLYEAVLKDPVADTAVYCRGRSNLAKARWLKDPGYNASNEFHEARYLRELTNDRLGLNASYSHLADYYLESRPDSARYYAEKMYRVATELDRADDQAEALEKLAGLNSGPNFNNYFPRYAFLTDSINSARSNDRKQFADIRFNFEEARANNLVLEKDNTQKRFRISRQRLIIYSTIILFTVLAIFGVLWYKRKKRFQELQTKTAIRESELKTSQKVHDVVANGLYQIMTNLEHQETIEKEPLLDKIESLYEKSRDLSYEHTVMPSGSFSKSLNTMLISFATPATKVLTVGNNQELWNSIPDNTRKELEYVLQELMINMTKHSKAQNVVINFEQIGHQLKIRYKDDGVGLTAGFQPGNGMRNTGNRILGIGGLISFERNTSKGLQVDISVPTT